MTELGAVRLRRLRSKVGILDEHGGLSRSGLLILLRCLHGLLDSGHGLLLLLLRQLLLLLRLTAHLLVHLPGLPTLLLVHLPGLAALLLILLPGFTALL